MLSPWLLLLQEICRLKSVSVDRSVLDQATVVTQPDHDTIGTFWRRRSDGRPSWGIVTYAASAPKSAQGHALTIPLPSRNVRSSLREQTPSLRPRSATT